LVDTVYLGAVGYCKSEEEYWMEGYLGDSVFGLSCGRYNRVLPFCQTEGYAVTAGFSEIRNLL